MDDTILEAQKQRLKNFIITGLTRTERLVIVLYYYEEMTIEQIAEALALSESVVSQVRHSTIARLKACIHGME